MIHINRSSNGGVSFPLTDIAIGQAIPPGPDPCCVDPGEPQPATINGHIRALPNANIAADPLSLRNVYAAWQTVSGGSVDIHFSRSINYGASWSTPVRLNDIATNAQFFPRMATGILFEADPNRSVVKVSWYDRRHDPANLDMHLFADSSGDGGFTWGTDVQWTEVESPLIELCPDHFDCTSPLCYFGDYNGLASLNPLSSQFILAWGDTRDTASGALDCAGGTSSNDPNVYTAVGC